MQLDRCFENGRARPNSGWPGFALDSASRAPAGMRLMALVGNLGERSATCHRAASPSGGSIVASEHWARRNKVGVDSRPASHDCVQLPRPPAIPVVCCRPPGLDSSVGCPRWKLAIRP
jgi:hypothetical protein